MGFPASCIYNEAGFILAVAADFASESHAAGSRKVSVCLQEVGKTSLESLCASSTSHSRWPKMLPGVPATIGPEMLHARCLFYICMWDTRDKMSARLLARKHSAAWTPRPSAGPSRHSRCCSTWLLFIASHDTTSIHQSKFVHLFTMKISKSLQTKPK